MNFALILFSLLVVSGGLWVADKVWARKHRAAEAPEPWWVEYGASFFPVILVVFVLRSFVAEPFKIPSGSMMPTLLVGDFILVNKFTYGIRLPVINQKIIPVGTPQRGDVMVFRYPEDPSLDYIKRVVGVPGDTVTYNNKRLTVNGQVVPVENLPDFRHVETATFSRQFKEKLGDDYHLALNDDEAPVFVPGAAALNFPFRDKCTYNATGFTCQVPDGHYFMMGDNRDNSRDSRFWGFVADDHIVGKAFFIWLNFGDFSRIGRFK